MPTPSFPSSIFFSNCFKNGILPIVPPAAEVAALFRQVEAVPGCRLVVDLPAQAVVRPADKIREFEARCRIGQPWLFS